VAHMLSPGGWSEPGQIPEFNEYTLVLKGVLHVEFKGGELDVRAGQAFSTQKGEWSSTVLRTVKGLSILLYVRPLSLWTQFIGIVNGLKGRFFC